MNLLSSLVLAALFAIVVCGCGTNHFGVECDGKHPCANASFECLPLATSCVLDNQNLSICTIHCHADSDCAGEGSNVVCRCGGVCDFQPAQ